ncbi:hypothetical protein NQ318_022399 [Aromia moschata]|uniref:Peptidase M10 metallopeptidase domain-containing protein n=1 Tax=Aromia moschata TaxID=1265417 RepID=A0AAV8Z4Q5_9CUCU|nr:hypothetical protein NQ318_022399 [Aromia moschata]
MAHPGKLVTHDTYNYSNSAFYRSSARIELTGEHGDNFPFDGRGLVLAHAFFPTGVQSSIDVHFDADESWITSGSSEQAPLEADIFEPSHYTAKSRSTVSLVLVFLVLRN